MINNVPNVKLSISCVTWNRVFFQGSYSQWKVCVGLATLTQFLAFSLATDVAEERQAEELLALGSNVSWVSTSDSYSLRIFM